MAASRAIRSCSSTSHPHPAWRHARKLHFPQALSLRLPASFTEQDHCQVWTFCGNVCLELMWKHFIVLILYFCTVIDLPLEVGGKYTKKYLSVINVPISGGVVCLSQARLQSWSWHPPGMWCWSHFLSADRGMVQSSKHTFKPSQKQVGVLPQTKKPYNVPSDVLLSFAICPFYCPGAGMNYFQRITWVKVSFPYVTICFCSLWRVNFLMEWLYFITLLPFLLPS